MIGLLRKEMFGWEGFQLLLAPNLIYRLGYVRSLGLLSFQYLLTEQPFESIESRRSAIVNRHWYSCATWVEKRANQFIINNPASGSGVRKIGDHCYWRGAGALLDPKSVIEAIVPYALRDNLGIEIR